MGSWFIVVNPKKRQYIRPSTFGDGITRSCILSGHHALAVACLACNVEELHSLGPPAGTWAGDPVIVASDDNNPGANGVETATSEQPDRNLYQLAVMEYDDISYDCLSMLVSWRPWILQNLAVQAAQDSVSGRQLLSHLGHLVDLGMSSQVEAALREHVGESWREKYKRK